MHHRIDVIERGALCRIAHVVIENHVEDMLAHQAEHIAGVAVLVGGLGFVLGRKVGGVDDVAFAGEAGAEHAPDDGRGASLCVRGIDAEAHILIGAAFAVVAAQGRRLRAGGRGKQAKKEKEGQGSFEHHRSP